MINVHHFTIRQSGSSHRIYVNDLLFGTIDEGVGYRWYLLLHATAEQFLVQKHTGLEPFYSISDISTGNLVGRVPVSLIFPFDAKLSLERKGLETIYWVPRNVFSLHWIWKQANNIIIEAVEDILPSGNSGMLKYAQSTGEVSLLTLLVFFLSLRRKQRLTLGFYHFNKNKEEKY